MRDITSVEHHAAGGQRSSPTFGNRTGPFLPREHGSAHLTGMVVRHALLHISRACRRPTPVDCWMVERSLQPGVHILCVRMLIVSLPFRTDFLRLNARTRSSRAELAGGSRKRPQGWWRGPIMQAMAITTPHDRFASMQRFLDSPRLPEIVSDRPG